MSPQFKPGDYVRAVQITGLWGRWHEGHIMKVGRLVAIHDPESYWGSYEVAFGNGMKYMVLEIEPATKADYDADWPEEEPVTPEAEPDFSNGHCKTCGRVVPHNSTGEESPGISITDLLLGNPKSDVVLETLQEMLAHYRMLQDSMNRKLTATNKCCLALEEAIADRIAARMDQLKGGEV